MPDEKGQPVRGEPGHWRYNKDTAAGNKFDKKGKLISQGPSEPPQTGKDTSTKTPGFEKLKKEEGKIPVDPNGNYTREAAEELNRKEQIKVLKARKVKVLSRDNEKQLIDKIMKSNPEGAPDENEADNNEDLDVPPEPPGATAKYTEENLKDFKAQKLVEILRSLGIKRIPLTEKGRIKKILESQ